MRRRSKGGRSESVCQGAGSPEVLLVRTMSHGYEERACKRSDESNDQHADESPANTHTRNIDLSEDRLDLGVHQLLAAVPGIGHLRAVACSEQLA